MSETTDAPRDPDQPFQIRSGDVNWPRAVIAVVAAGVILALSIALAAVTTLEVVSRVPTLSEVQAEVLIITLMQVFSVVLCVLVVSAHKRWRSALLLNIPQGQRRSVIPGIVAVSAFILGVCTVLAVVFLPEMLRRDISPFFPLIESDVWWVAVLAVVVGAPISEEILFRGFLVRELTQAQVGFGWAAGIANVMWTAAHFNYSIVGLSFVFLAGVLFSWALYRTGSVWVTIAMHALYNIVALIVMVTVFR
ncbi:MAG: CPBP family intramembrane glutamic endopeptidase [Pseudomonadota bacterium]